MLFAIAFLATIFAANWAIATFGVVPVAPGLAAPAGVYAAGLAFTFRDLVHERFGRSWTLVLIVVGAALSALISTRFAAASGVAFLVSELADYAVYAPLRRRGRIAAVVASNIAGIVVDSALFLTLAFGSLAFLPGQIVGKLWMTAAAVVAMYVWRRTRMGQESLAKAEG